MCFVRLRDDLFESDLFAELITRRPPPLRNGLVIQFPFGWRFEIAHASRPQYGLALEAAARIGAVSIVARLTGMPTTGHSQTRQSVSPFGSGQSQKRRLNS